MEEPVNFSPEHLRSEIESGGTRWLNCVPTHVLLEWAPDQTFNQRGSLIHRAGQYGNRLAVLTLVERGIFVDEVDERGSTALMWAAQHEHAGVVSLLLDKGAAIEASNRDGWTSIIFAADKGHAEVVSLLLDRGAAIEAGTNESRTSLMLAAIGA